MGPLVNLFERSGVRVCFSGHEHNFQHARHNNIDYVVTGAGSKIRTGKPNRFAEARTVSWASKCHFLLVTIDGAQMTIRAIGEDPSGGVVDIEREAPDGTAVTGPIMVAAG